LQIARVHLDELATPVTALHVDGAFYDVAVLEELWRVQPPLETTDFHARVVAARCAGLEPLHHRLESGDRPTEARLRPEDFVALPPCDVDHAAWLQLPPYATELAEPVAVRRDARQLVGDGQPVAVQDPRVEAGLAVILAEELWQASAREAERAVLGFTAMLDWSGDGPAQLGPHLMVGPRLRDVGRMAASIEIAGVRHEAGNVSAWRFEPAAALAFLSHRHRLVPGDVVGLGCLRAGRHAPAFGERVAFLLDRRMTLRGWAVQAPAPVPWRA
jgi:2-keto-4-pentenoate hydratase/2-oxohepta-3-ene-1,7-dioic acid hydratase in catechol pathway